MKNIAERRAILTSLIEEKTTFHYDVDFSFIEIKHSNAKRPQKDEFVILKFKKTKTLGSIEKKEIVLEVLKAFAIIFQEEVGRLYVKLPEGINPGVILDDPSNHLETKKINQLNEKLCGLIRLHKSLGILGKKNADQPDFANEIVNFNYLDEEEAQYAFQTFSALGLTLMLRENKKCNISFMLEEKDMTEITEKPKRNFEGKTTRAILWALRKFYGKIPLNTPGDTNYGVSERCRVSCREIDMIEIKKDLEHHYNLFILIHSVEKKDVDIFFLTSKKSINLYLSKKGKLTPKELIELLKSPEIPAMQQNQQIIEKRMTELSSTVNELLKKEGFFLNGKSNEGMYLQIHRTKENGLRVEGVRGDLNEKQALIEKVIEVITGKFPKAEFKRGTLKTNFTVRIEGYVSTVLAKPRQKKNNNEIPVVKETTPETKMEAVDPIAEKEAKLKTLLENPLLNEETKVEIISYFNKKDVNQQAKNLLAELLGNN